MSPPLPASELEATQKFYDRISHAYDLISDASEHKARERALAMLTAKGGEHVLEIGFGTGHGLEDLARAVGPEGRVTGIDISPGMQRVALARLEKRDLAGRVDLTVGAAPPLPFEDATFDGAFMSFTLELFPDEVIPVLLEEVRRVLRPGGRLALAAMATHPGSADSLLERAYKWTHRHFPHIVDCRPIDVTGVLERAGFRIDDQTAMEIWTLPVRAVVAARD